MQIITLTTDYGTKDHYVGVLKGVMLSIATEVRLVDITHDIEPHSVACGAFVVAQCAGWFPPGTIHVVVVDPGVGTNRRIILGRFNGRYIVAPDNGLITFLHRDTPAEVVHVVENRRYVLPNPSATFQGRDIMAPVAAHLANGVKPHEFGPVTDRVEMLAVPHRAAIESGAIVGRVLYVDHFGTLVTNVHVDQLITFQGGGAGLVIDVDGRSVGPLRAAFADVAVGELAALVGGAGLLEIAVNQGRASERFAADAEVRVTSA